MKVELAEKRTEPIDWWHIDGVLLHEHGIKPAEADQMTLSEIALALERPRPSSDNLSYAEINERLGSWRKLTPKEKLLYGRRT